MSNLSEQTFALKHLIERAKSSAMNAWDAGGILNNVFQDHFENRGFDFNRYTNKEFGITAETAQKYINLFTHIPREMITDDMLVTHLYPIIDIKKKELQLLLLEVMRSFKSQDNMFGQPAKQVFTGKDIDNIVTLIEIGDLTGKEEIEKKLIEVISKRKKITKNKKKFDQVGHKIEGDHFEELKQIYPNSPIDEQGLVGIFCAMFYFLNNFEIAIGGNLIKFKQIEYIRTDFPDGRIISENAKRKERLVYLDVEFEFESMNYIKHKHHRVKNKKCDMIICWKNNFRKEKEYKNIPVVFALEELFKTGRIDLYNPQQLDVKDLHQ